MVVYGLFEIALHLIECVGTIGWSLEAEAGTGTIGNYSLVLFTVP